MDGGPTEEHLAALKRAVEAGYYKTEADPDGQETFPWANRHCRDCPFWMHDICQVDMQPCTAGDIPCTYYTPPDFTAAKERIHQRLWLSWRKRWRFRTRAR